MYCFAKICRLCLSHDSALIHCRARDKNNIPNYHKIKILFPQLVNKTSHHFPIWICMKCQEQVNQSYEFKQKCYKTYKLLKKYSLQLFEANQDNYIPDVPPEIFQEVKPIIDNRIISIDEEDPSENFYKADDITIVKNELLPSNFKNEPEYHNMIQEIIDRNIEAIRQIDGDDTSSLKFKRELISNFEANNQLSNFEANNTNTLNNQISNIEANHTNTPNNQLNNFEANNTNTPNNQLSNYEANNTNTPNNQLVQEDVQPIQTVSPPIVPENNNETNSIISAATTTDKENESNNPIYSLDSAAFTLDYTNASFETFASHIAPCITVPSENVPKVNATNTEENTATNIFNRFTRVLRRRKPICYRNVEKFFYKFEHTISSENAKKKTVSSTKKTYKIKSAVTQITTKKQNKVFDSISNEKNSKADNSKTKNTSITRDLNLIEKAIKEYKQKYGAYYCTKCSKQYVILPKFRLHVSQCTGNVHQCTVCKKFFASSANLRRHGKIHLKFKLKVK